jgi:DDE superfamily endonuclease
MSHLPKRIIHLVRQFECALSERVWERAKVLLIGAILAPGERTVTAILRVMGLSQENQFQNYHRVLSRARWSSPRWPTLSRQKNRGSPLLQLRRMDFILGGNLCQGLLFLYEFLNDSCCVSRCILFSHHAGVYLLSASFRVQIHRAIIAERSVAFFYVCW